MTDKETALCNRYSKRDKNGKVHCFECPLVIDKTACVCKKVLEESQFGIIHISTNKGVGK